MSNTEERKEVRRKLFQSTSEDRDNLFMEQLLREGEADAAKRLAQYVIIRPLDEANSNQQTNHNNNCTNPPHQPSTEDPK